MIFDERDQLGFGRIQANFQTGAGGRGETGEGLEARLLGARLPARERLASDTGAASKLRSGDEVGANGLDDVGGTHNASVTHPSHPLGA